MLRRLRRLVLMGLLAALAPRASVALDVTGTSVGLTWTAATGPVTGYVVYLSRNGGGYQEVQRVASTSAQVAGNVGDTVQVRVAAHDAQGKLGPQSDPSDPVSFVAPPTDPPPTDPPPTTPPPPGGPVGDLDGDGRADTLAFHARSGQLEALLLQSDGTRVAQTIGTQENPNLRPVGYADVDGDGEADVLWSDGRPTGTAAEVWLLRGTSFETLPLPDHEPGSAPAAFRDFDGDGRADVLWYGAARPAARDASGDLRIWRLDGSGLVGQVFLGAPPAGTVLAAVLDFDGDGSPDLLWKDPATGALEAWKMNGTSPGAVVELGSVKPARAVARAGDLDGDGVEDLLWSGRRGGKPTLEAWFMHGMDAPSRGAVPPLPAGRRLVGLIDVDSDGRAEVVARKRAPGGQTFEAFRVLPSGETDPSGGMQWSTDPVPMDSAPMAKAWAFVTAE